MRPTIRFWGGDLGTFLQRLTRHVLLEVRISSLTASQTLVGPYTQILTLILSFWTQGKPYDRGALRKGFLNHYEHIRSVVPPSKLLEFQPEDGWEPVCKFLDKDIPDGPYPHSNEGTYTADRHWWAMPIRTAVVVGKVLAFSAPVAVALVVAGWFKNGH